MSDADDHPRGTSDTASTGHVPPDGSAWLRAQRTMAARNDEVRRAGKQERKEHERQLAELRRRAYEG